MSECFGCHEDMEDCRCAEIAEKQERRAQSKINDNQINNQTYRTGES
jgi:hypothetical protein